MNLCSGIKSGIEVAIHAVREQENLGRGDTGEDIRDRLETDNQAQLRVDLARKR